MKTLSVKLAAIVASLIALWMLVMIGVICSGLMIGFARARTQSKQATLVEKT